MLFIANAAIGTDWRKTNELDTNVHLQHLNVNAVGPLILFQALYPLLLKRNTRKFTTISTIAGSITNPLPIPNATYGSSKAALNFITRSIHNEHHEDGFIVFLFILGW